MSENPRPTPPAASPVAEARLDGLFKHSAMYSAAPIVRQLISIGMHRLYTEWLRAPGVGVKEAVDLWLIALQQILGQNVLAAMARFYFDHRDERDRASVVTSCTLLITIAAWVVCGTAFAFAEDLTPLMLGRGGTVGSVELVQIVKLALLLIPFQLATISGLYYLQILKRSGLFTAIQTGKLVFEVGLNFVFIMWLDLGVRGFLLSMMAGEALTSLGLVGWILLTMRPRIDWRILRPILVYSAPLIPVGLCQLALHQIDRRLILHYADQEVLGIYGHGYKIGLLVTAMMLGPFIQIWHPWIFGMENARERAALVARVSTYAVLTIAVASLAVVFGGRQAAIVLTADERLYAAYQVIPFVAGGYVFWALYHVSQIPLFLAKRTVRLFAINLAAAALNVGLNVYMIPAHGIVGAAATTCLTFAFLAALGMIASRSEAQVPFELRRLAGILACVVAGGALALFVDELNAEDRLAWTQAVGIKTAAFLVLALLLFYGTLRTDERRRFIDWIARRTGRAIGK